VFVRGDGVLLVDTKLANNGQALLDQIKKVTDKPITHIVNTHTHGDHTAAAVLPRTRRGRHAREHLGEHGEDAGVPSRGRQGRPPDRTFKDKMTLFSGKESVDLYYFGAAPTNGDAFVVFRDARVMHAGDLFATKGLPLLDVNNGGSGVAIGDTIAKAAAGIKNVDRVITGHSDTMVWQDRRLRNSLAVSTREGIARGGQDGR
jgi:glyoxylase-like metal-dependent hydrolase (beta-lactamase superfamily II)